MGQFSNRESWSPKSNPYQQVQVRGPNYICHINSKQKIIK